MSGTIEKLNLPNQLLWLADSPLFIDTPHIEAFYDAVVRPYYRQGVTVSGSDSEMAAELVTELGLGTEFDSGKLLGILSAWLPKLKATAEGKLTGKGDYKSTATTTTEWHPITTPQRQLEQLVLHYFIYQRSRIIIDPANANGEMSLDWANPTWIKESPRGLVLLDLPPKTKFIPTYGEYGDGNTPGLIYEKIPGGDQKYPNNPNEEQKYNYWKTFDEKFDVQTAVKAVEGAGEGRLQVIDYRIPISGNGQSLHLHLNPRGQYPKITFAYNLIRRSFEHGVRLVGTMRSEPDMNVLAIYER